MWLSHLNRVHFRNPIHIDGPYAQFNGIFGQNGRGKTNFLEAIYYLTHLKSWRVSQPRDLIHWDETEANLVARFESLGREHEMKIRFFPRSRDVLLDQKPLRSWEAYRTPLVSILFSPEDAYLWREEPDRRRSALDQMIFHRDPAYAGLVSRYLKSLKQKNALLRSERVDPLSLDSWNEQLLVYGSEILFRRADWLNQLFPYLQTAYHRIVQGQNAREVLAIKRRFLGVEEPVTPVPSREAFEITFRLALAARKKQEAMQKMSLVGPHRDDWWLLIEGKSVATTASQGEHRSLILALKLAELELVKQAVGEPPIFLVDDLTSELDPLRRRFLLETLVETGCQIFLTSTESGPFLDLIPKDSRLYTI